MRRHLVLSGVVVTMAVCLLGVSGCDSSDPEPDATVAASPSAEPEETTPSVSPLPDGYQYVTAPEAGFQFAVPDDWSAVDAETILSDPAMQSVLDDMAARQGVTADDLMSAGVDMVAMSDLGIPNVNVIEPQSGKLSSAFVSQNTAYLESMFGATDMSTREVTTAVGDAAVASYTFAMQGATFYQNQIYQQVSSSMIAVITVTGSDADEAAGLTDTVLDTLEPID